MKGRRGKKGKEKRVSVIDTSKEDMGHDRIKKKQKRLLTSLVYHEAD